MESGGSMGFMEVSIAVLLAGYLFGAIPFGLVLTKLAGLGDIRNIGSGNIGATNVLRTGRKGLALATLLLDGGKGAVAVLIVNFWLGQEMAVLAGGGAFLGHLFPVWLKFKGGKGVATFFGVLLAISWPVGLLAALTWIATAFLFRLSSLSALLAAALAPVYCALFMQTDIGGIYYGDPERLALVLFMAVLVIIRHHQNIRRLLKGDEPRIGKD